MSTAPARGSTLALVGLLFIFAGFVVYQTSVDAGYIQPHLGGFYTGACVLVLPFAGYIYARDVIREGIGKSRAGWLFAAFLALFGISIAGGWGIADPDITDSHASYLFKFLVLFMVARMLDPASKKFAIWTLLAFLVVAAVLSWRSLDVGLLLTELARQENPEFMLDYQGIGHATLVLAMLCAPVMRWRFALYIFAMPVLFISGARSELVAFLLAAAVIELCKARSAILLFGAWVLGGVILATGLQLTDLPEHRMFNLLKPSEDQSVQERAEFTQQALQTVQESPILGAYASYENGTYAHNILSAWVDLGLLGILLLVAIMFGPLISLLSRFRTERTSPLYILTLVSFTVSILLLVFAKTFTYQTVPLALGLYCRWKATSSTRPSGRTNAKPQVS